MYDHLLAVMKLSSPKASFTTEILGGLVTPIHQHHGITPHPPILHIWSDQTNIYKETSPPLQPADTSNLEGKSHTRNTHNSSLDLRTPQQCVTIRSSLQSPRQRLIALTTEIIIIGHCMSRIRAIERLAASDKDIALNQHLSTISSIDTIADSIEI